MKQKKTLIGALILIVLAALGIFCWNGMSPTRVGMVNYPDYMLAAQLDQDFGKFLNIEPVTWNDKTDPAVLRRYDVLYFFGMGLQFNDAQKAAVDELIRQKKPLYITASTRSETKLDTLPPEHSKQVQAYMRAGGKTNFKRLMDYTRRVIDGKFLFSAKVLPPKEIPRSAFFHPKKDEETVLATYQQYVDFYKRLGKYNPANPTVCIFSGNGGGDLESLVEALEAKQLNVVGISGMMDRIRLLDMVKPELIIYQPHGRLSINDPAEALEALKRLNIPLFCPIKVSQPYDEYLRDQRGMTGGMLSQSVIMPELDGGAVPFVLSALFPNKRGLMEFRTIPDRLDRFTTMVRKTVDLKRKPNSEKKIAIIYYKGPGQNAMNAAGLEVGDSLLNTLKYLKSQGFTTGELPETPEALNKKIQENAAVFGTYAKGAIQDFIRTARVELIPPEEYLSWIRKSMPDDLYAEVEKQYGPVPGNYLTVEKDGKQCMALGMLRFGNIVVMPQGLPAYGDDTNKLVHGVKQAPPHTYIATYLWIRHKFQADALMHFGTHGSLEFTPWKQIALSSFDWPDILIGEMPHYYLYVINNIGEALIAKRRTYATMVSHLTAPFMNSGTYGELHKLEEKIEAYESADSAMLKDEYRKTIIDTAVREKLHIDLKLSPDFAKGILHKEDLDRLHGYLHEIEDSKVNRGVYVIGRPYSKEEADETARLMMVDTVADQLFKADLKAGKVKEKDRDNITFFKKNYLDKANAMLVKEFQNPTSIGKTEPEKRPARSTQPGGMGGMAPEKMKEMLAKMPPQMREAFEKMSPEERRSMMRQMGGRRRGPARAAKPKLTALAEAHRIRQSLLESTQAELRSVVNAFSGGYLTASPGGDPVSNPATVPTGRNLYGIDPERTPTRESYAVGKKLGEALIAAKLKKTGKYPKKAAFTLWGGEFIRGQGTNIGEIFFLLGVEPVWDSRGRVQDVRLIPDSELKRPRIDVIVQTSGQFRGAATSRMRLIDKAVKLAAVAPVSEYGNYVKEGSEAAIRTMIGAGMSPEQARSLGDARIFGGVNGNFGTGVTGLVQAGDRWEDSKVIADLYLNNMGALYTDERWGEMIPGVFKAAMQNTDTVIQPRSSNSWGPLSLDHVYEFMGGINLTIKNVTGKEPDAYFNDLRTPGRAKIQDAEEAAMVEARSTVLNPKYIKEMMEEGPGAAGTFAEVFRNSYGWKVMKPDMLKDHLFDEYKAVYIDDKLKLNIREYFEKKNPAALQEMTAVLLETARKGLWKTDASTLKQIAQVHAELVKKFGPGCSGFVCNNAKLKEFIAQNIDNQPLKQEYSRKIEKIRTASAAKTKKENVEGMTLKKQEIIKPETERQPVSRKTMIFLLLGIAAIGLIALRLGRRKDADNE